MITELTNAIKRADAVGDAKIGNELFDIALEQANDRFYAALGKGKIFAEVLCVYREYDNKHLCDLAKATIIFPYLKELDFAKDLKIVEIANKIQRAIEVGMVKCKNREAAREAYDLYVLDLKKYYLSNKEKFPEIYTNNEYTSEVLDAAKKIVESNKREEEKLRADVIEATATPVEEDQNAVAAYLPEGKEIVKRGRKPKAKENIKDAEIVEESFKVAKQVEPPKAVPLGSAAQPTQTTVPPVPMPEKKGGYFDQVKQPDVFKVTLDPNNPSITFIPAEQQPQPQQAAPIVQPPVQQTQSDMPNLNNLIQPEEPVKDQKTFMGPKVKIVEDKPVEEFGLKPDVKVTTPPSQQIIDPPMPQPVNPQYATIPNMGNFKVVPPETNVNTGINNPILLFKENIGEVGFILTFGNYVVPKEIFTRLDYSNLVNTQFDCGIILCDITSIFGNPETYRMIKDITKSDYLPMFRYVGNNPSGRAVFYREQVTGKTVRIEVVENNGTANISVKAI